MAEHLKNGAEVIARCGEIVLAHRPKTATPWITWRVDCEDNAYWGRYFTDYQTALMDFVNRSHTANPRPWKKG